MVVLTGTRELKERVKAARKRNLELELEQEHPKASQLEDQRKVPFCGERFRQKDTYCILLDLLTKILRFERHRSVKIL